jgi:hypothetical protein
VCARVESRARQHVTDGVDALHGSVDVEKKVRLHRVATLYRDVRRGPNLDDARSASRARFDREDLPTDEHDAHADGLEGFDDEPELVEYAFKACRIVGHALSSQ